MNKEIEEAVKYFKRQSLGNKGLAILLSLAQEYLAVKGMPEEKKISAYKGIEPDLSTTALIGQEQGFNQALHLCKLALLKKEAEWKEKLPSEEELIKFLLVEMDDRKEYSVASLAHSIHKLILEKLGEKEER